MTLDELIEKLEKIKKEIAGDYEVRLIPIMRTLYGPYDVYLFTSHKGKTLKWRLDGDMREEKS